MDKDSAYFKWLVSKVATPDEQKAFDSFYRYLDSVEFYAVLPDDENRIEEALWNRSNDFTSDLNIDYDSDRYCSVLEIMVSLITRVIQANFADDIEERCNRLFWYMIDSLWIDPDDNTDILDKAMDKFLTRRYTKTGKGNLFYLPWEDRDVRGLSLWQQAMSYINVQDFDD